MKYAILVICLLCMSCVRYYRVPIMIEGDNN